MKNKLGFYSIVLLGINGIIGTGIFALPSEAYNKIGAASILALIFNGILVFTIALCFAEVSSYFNQNGAAYVYAKEAFGELPGFIVGFMKYSISAIAWAAFAILITTSGLKGLAEVLDNKAFINIVGSSYFQKFFPILIIVTLTIMNLTGVKTSKIVNNIVTISKLLPLILLIGIGIFFIKGENFFPLASGDIVATEINPVGVFISTCILLLFTLTGFESLATAAEDMEDPQKNLPKALILTMGIVTIFYILVMLVTIGILGPETGASDAPLTNAAEKVSPILGILVGIGATISMLGIAIAGSFVTPRALEPLSEDKFLPGFISKKNKKGVAVWAILISGVISALIASTGKAFELAAISVIARFIQYIPTCISVIVFRSKYKDAKGYKMPFGLLIPVIAIALSVFMLYSQGRNDIIEVLEDAEKTIFNTRLFKGLIGVVIAIPIYYIGKILSRNEESK